MCFTFQVDMRLFCVFSSHSVTFGRRGLGEGCAEKHVLKSLRKFWWFLLIKHQAQLTQRKYLVNTFSEVDLRHAV